HCALAPRINREFVAGGGAGRRVRAPAEDSGARNSFRPAHLAGRTEVRAPTGASETRPARRFCKPGLPASLVSTTLRPKDQNPGDAPQLVGTAAHPPTWRRRKRAFRP